MVLPLTVATARSLIRTPTWLRVRWLSDTTFPLPPSSGLGNQIINGGQLSVQGNEAVISAVPLRSSNFEWAMKVIYNQNVQRVDNIPVPAFNAPNSFGATYGRNRIVAA